MSNPNVPNSPDAAELLKPDTRLGKYTVVHRIAFGGMAEIYLARVSGIEGFEKYVVLKRILPQFATDPEFVRMFLQEARVAAALDHANISHVYDIGQENGVFFFTMEYLHGHDVRSIVRHLRTTKARLPLEQALTVVIGAATGLHFAHEKRGAEGESMGIVHRDVSPSNIVVTHDGGVKVVDFGIAKMTSDPELSRRYSLKGKLSYMAPEQMARQAVDRRSDIFSLGIVLYELTTRSRLFRSESEVETMRKVLEGVIPRPSELVPGYPAELEAIVLRALEREPQRRFQTARELEVALEDFARDQRLHVSSAALGEWMELTFGRQFEPWRQSRTRSVSEPAVGATPPPSHAEPTANTKVVPGQAGRNHWQDQGADIAAAVAPVRKPPRNRRTVAAMGATLVVLILVAAGALAAARIRRSTSASLVSANPEPSGSTALVVLTESGKVELEPAGVNAANANQGDAPAAGGAAHQPPAKTPAQAQSIGASRRSVRLPAARGAPRDQGFSAVFARREGEIRRCFAAPGVEAAGAGEVALRFQVGVDGHVTEVSVLPAIAATTPLGACLVRIGRSTVFASQPEPVTFRIPLSVQVQGRGHGER